MQAEKFLLKDKEDTLYSEKVKEQIISGISSHYLESRKDEKWSEVENMFLSFYDELENEIKNLKKKKIFDYLMLFAYYKSCNEAVDRYEIQNILFEISKEKYDFARKKINFNRPVVKRIVHLSLKVTELKLSKKSLIMDLKTEKYDREEKCVSFAVNNCLIYKLAEKYGCLEIIPAFCNSEYNLSVLANCFPVRHINLSEQPKCTFLLLDNDDENNQIFSRQFDDNGIIITEERM